MTENFTPALGDRVTITDYLLRAKLSYTQILALAEQGVTIPEGMLSTAGKEQQQEDEYRRRDAERGYPHYPMVGREYKMWLPHSVHAANRHNHIKGRLPEGAVGWISTDNKRHGVPMDLQLPITGVVVRKLKLSDGLPMYEEYGHDWDSCGLRTGYQVAYSLHRRPVNAYPEMIQEVTGAPDILPL
ncbi:hypothetical protein [Nesterenkonia flava]|uniref:Uncharacterized protein n=1 Tax=Nesterenkonia flava TaxID=469799 RepID=A0ABU1FW56_9MICC|nr:hypothetical protein [Nesterenkonia flava]MDR5712914.1 hypothetical protein [Nesterenkonia flava]